MDPAEHLMPPHIEGMFSRAAKKSEQAMKRYRALCRCRPHPDMPGFLLVTSKNARSAHRAKAWDRAGGKWLHRMQIVVPYLDLDAFREI